MPGAEGQQSILCLSEDVVANCYIIITLGTRYAQASEGRLQSVTFSTQPMHLVETRQVHLPALQKGCKVQVRSITVC